MDKLRELPKNERYTIKTTTILNSYGDIVELDWKFDSDTIIQELKSVDNWIDGSNHKKGLPLTGGPLRTT